MVIPLQVEGRERERTACEAADAALNQVLLSSFSTKFKRTKSSHYLCTLSIIFK